MTQQLTYLKETASQTAGPYVHIGLAPQQAGFDIFEKNFSNTLTQADTKGEKIRIEGRVFDGSGSPMRDVLIEIWQANAEGSYQHPADPHQDKREEGFRGWGRGCTDFDSGVYTFNTVKPGAVVGRNGRMMAPHINFWVVARGINVGLNTRMYFSDEAEANQADPVLNLIELQVRRKTLVAERTVENGEVVYTFDIVIQGENETVFLDI